MAFYGNSFIFDGIPSEMYDLNIINFSTGQIQTTMGSGVELFTKQVYRKPKNYFYGTSQSPVLEFPILFGSERNFCAETRSKIGKWLFGQQSYKKLQIVQDDLQNVYFNCILTEPTVTYAGNLSYAIQANVICDSPFAWEFPRTRTWTFTGNNVVNANLEFYNNSDNSDYTYPYLEFYLNTVGTDFDFWNATDDVDRHFIFSNLSPNERVTVDNERQILTSSTGLRRLSNFNLNWFRLVSGFNHLRVRSGIGTIVMTTQNAKKVGG